MQGEGVCPESSWRDTPSCQLGDGIFFLTPMFQLGKAKLRNSFKVIRKRAPAESCSYYTSDSTLNMTHTPVLLAQDTRLTTPIYPGTYRHIFSTTARYSFLLRPLPLASVCAMGRASTFGYSGGRQMYSIVGSKEFAKYKVTWNYPCYSTSKSP